MAIQGTSCIGTFFTYYTCNETKSHQNREEGVLRIIQRYFSYFSTKTYIVTRHLNRLGETVQVRCHSA